MWGNTPQGFLYNGRHGVQTDDNGLYYMRARYYNTDLKRFMNRDILLGDQSDIQTLNRYAFVNGNPISYHDPFGLARESATGWSISNFIHTALDFAGMIPVFGEVFDVANSIYYLAEGNYEEAIWSGVSAIPFVGNAATVGKYGVKTVKVLNKNRKTISGTKEIGTGYKYKYKYWNRETEFRGIKVYQRNDIINPKLVDARGRTNKERMKKGLAPIGPDGKSVNLHHTTQRDTSTIAEVTQTFHKENSKIIHINPNTIPSGINRNEFGKFRRGYWKFRSDDF